MKPYDPAKRALDVLIGGVALVISLPAQGIVACLIKRKLGSPVLFRQHRPGKNEKIFELVKFRTMVDVDESKGLVTDEQRMTPFGALLRSTSLDELPSLWNVLKGDMSLVGPRPLRVKYLPRYSTEQARRHEVRPGITGLAQVSGRNAISWEAKFAKDVEYVDRRSLRLDITIILATVAKVLRRDGISAEGAVTMTEFLGSEDSRG
jgi:lipopolysaccharide/colanic/teichoic acid biosynthesis glycosyltransferase